MHFSKALTVSQLLATGLVAAKPLRMTRRTTGGTTVQQVGDWTYTVCAIEPFNNGGGGRVIADATKVDQAMTVEMCAAFCSNYTYFGVEWSTECYCGNTISSQTGYEADDSQCNYECAGDATERCGGSGHLSLYTQDTSDYSYNAGGASSSTSSTSVAAATPSSSSIASSSSTSVAAAAPASSSTSVAAAAPASSSTSVAAAAPASSSTSAVVAVPASSSSSSATVVVAPSSRSSSSIAVAVTSTTTAAPLTTSAAAPATSATPMTSSSSVASSSSTTAAPVASTTAKASSSSATGSMTTLVTSTKTSSTSTSAAATATASSSFFSLASCPAIDVSLSILRLPFHFTPYYAGSGYTENCANPGNLIPALLPARTYQIAGTYTACQAAQQCLVQMQSLKLAYLSFDLHYLTTTKSWACNAYSGNNVNSKYFNVPNSAVSYAYGFNGVLKL